MGSASIIPFGGIGEIGGNKFLIIDGDSRLLFDFGKCFERWKRFFDYPFSVPGKGREDFLELINLGLIPAPKKLLEGLYTESLPGKPVNVSEEPSTDIRACLFSHVHSDHTGYLALLNRRIKAYISEAAWRIIRTYYEHASVRTIESDISGFDAGINVETFRGRSTKMRGLDIPVTAVAVDHSVPGSYGFVFEISEGLIAYTGDIRWHGPYSEGTNRFVRKAKGADYLLCDCTNIRQGDVKEENDVERLLTRAMETYKGLVVNISSIDTDRINTIYKAASRVGRRVILSLKIATALARLEGLRIKNFPRLGDMFVYEKTKEPFRVWEMGFLKRPPRGYGTFEEYVKMLRSRRRSRNRLEVLMKECEYGGKYAERRSVGDVLKDPDTYVIVTSFGSTSELRDFFRIGGPGCLRGGAYVQSASEPFNEEMQVKHEKLLSWITELGMPYCHIHSSGHAYQPSLQRMIEEIEPNSVVPIHCERPEIFEKIIGVKGSIIPACGKDILRTQTG